MASAGCRWASSHAVTRAHTALRGRMPVPGFRHAARESSLLRPGRAQDGARAGRPALRAVRDVLRRLVGAGAVMDETTKKKTSSDTAMLRAAVISNRRIA